MPAPKPWRFEQLGGPRRVLELTGYSAPFGRPRDKPVVQRRLHIRQRTVRYPGFDGPPTRHVFGDAHEPWELSGRFTARDGGRGFAKAKTQEVDVFVRDKQEVRISWGDILSFRGFCEFFESAFESEEEVAWKLGLQIDVDLFADEVVRAPVPPSPRDAFVPTKKLLQRIRELENDPAIRPSILDAFGSITSSISSVFSAVSQLATKLTGIEQAVATDVARLRAGIGQLRTGILQLRELALATRADSLTIGRTFTTDARVGGILARLDVESVYALAALARLDRAAAVLTTGAPSAGVLARAGDSWESLSIRTYGGPDRADAIRQANAIRGAAQPVPGRTYTIPP